MSSLLVAAIALLSPYNPTANAQQVEASQQNKQYANPTIQTTSSFLTDTFVILFISYVSMQVVLFTINRRRQHRTFERMQIPGPKPHFIHGHLYDTRREAYVEYADRMHRIYGKNVGVFLGGDAYLITKDLELIQQVFIAKSRLFYNRMNFYFNVDPVPDNLICQRGDRWRYMRKLLTPAFSNQKIRSSQFYRDTQRTVEKFMGQLKANQSTKNKETIVYDVYDRMAAIALDVIVKTAFHMDNMISFSGSTGSTENKQIPASFAGCGESKYKMLNRCLDWIKQQYVKQFVESKPKNVDFFLTTLKRAIRVGFNPLIELLFCFPFLDAPLTFLCNRVYFSSILTLLLERLDHLVRKPLPTGTMATKSASIDARTSEALEPQANDDDPIKNSHTTQHQQRRRIIDSLIEVLRERKITRNEFVGNAFVIVFAGFETTANSLTFSLWLLAQHKHVQDKLRNELRSLRQKGLESHKAQQHRCDGVEESELDLELAELATGCNYLEAVINESLRLYPPVPERDVNVLPSVYSIHRDKSIWGDQADDFIPERFELLDINQTNSAMFMPFGLGPRNCIGKAAALHELKIVIGRLVMEYSIEPEVNLTPSELKLCSPLNITITTSERIGLKFIKL